MWTTGPVAALTTLALTACGSRVVPGGPAEPGRADRAPPPPATYCPRTAATDAILPWLPELFPGCPPGPLPRVVTCEGPCARPCRSEQHATATPGAPPRQARYTYDAQGRWTGTDDGGAQTGCSYQDDRLASCILPEGPASAVRDRTGRLTAVQRGGQTVAIARDEHGRVRAVGAASFAYDGRGRIVRADDTTIEYDEAGRVTRELDPLFEQVRAYDQPRGRLDTITTTPRTGGPPRVSHLTYDADGRLTSFEVLGRVDEDSRLTIFDYACP